ncbi:MAG: TonB-dependent receptor [Phenylobacterium sp.]|uniref:TonB-dependent receptor n=1 Tax=Phenylobacterium sp. TaxID=1871053 RepID=UPI0017B40224|nr:TonB-dependent receptor [Phenylobacterium sp.]MBA4793839.1 TonB-dependent receptor [Phenylobacterium sp.]
MTRLKSFRGLLLAGAACLVAVPAAAQTAQQSRGSTLVEEIIVTATKREESVREISGSVSAVSGAQLEALGAQSYADYIARTPGVVFNEFQPGTSHVVIRGVATSSGNVQGQGTTGYYINEVPLTEPGWTIVIPDIDAFDVDHVEILRGPQGSLFGSASMGGAVNYVANKADASGYDAEVEGTLSQTKNADLGGGLKGMINIPIIEDTLAVRAVGTYRNDPGYLDNVGIGEDGSSDITISGGRLSVVWTPSDATELSWMSLYQKTEADDAPYRNPAIGDLARSTALAEPNDTDVTLHSLRLDQDFGFATLTALAAYQEKSQDFLFDYTPWRSAYNADLGLNLTSPLYIESGGESEGKSLEVRLASNGEGRFEWLFGGMYYESDKFLYEQIGAAGAAAAFDASPLYGPGSGAVISPDGEIFNAYFTDLKAKETALFGEASFNFTPELKLMVGGRLFKTEIDSVSTRVGFSTYPGAPVVEATVDEQDGFSPKVSLTYAPNDDFMVYGLYSEGFRFGTPNMQGLSSYPVPSGSESDSLKNYEVGVRSNLLNDALLLDATAFYIDWSDIQLRLLTPDNYNYAANGGAAKIKGLEVSASYSPTPQLDLQSTVTWMEARLDEPLFILWYGTAPEGSRLPGSADWSVSNTLSYRFETAYDPTLILSHRYLSSGISDLNSAVPGITPNTQGDYNLIDLRLRANFGQTTVTLFGSNLGDERGVTRTLPEANGLSQGLVRPRTFGITLNWAL